MSSMIETARMFFEACDTGQGWAACEAYCTPDATFTAQAEPLANVHSLQQYADWMTWLMRVLPDGRYVVKSFAVDEGRRNVSIFGVFSGTHTGEGGPCPATGKTTHTNYVYVMDFDGDKISHMTKIWNSGLAVRELGWI
jgi:ketosteroid isomerase-like protein